MRDLDLVRLYWPVELRPAFDALFGPRGRVRRRRRQLDAAGARRDPPGVVARRAHQARPISGTAGAAPPGGRTELLPLGIGGTRLAVLEDGWTTLFEERPDEARIADHGAALFAIGADLLGASDPLIADAGRVYALADVARRGLHPGTSVSLARLTGHRFPRKLRPLTMLGHWPVVT